MKPKFKVTITDMDGMLLESYAVGVVHPEDNRMYPADFVVIEKDQPDVDLLDKLVTGGTLLDDLRALDTQVADPE